MFKKLRVLIMLIAILVLGVYYYADSQGVSVQELFFVQYPVVRVGGVPLTIEIANTDEARTRGLSGREAIDPIQGLLFIFDESDYHGVWMQDMTFPIDVIWIDENFKIIEITEGLLPESYPRVYEPPQPVRYFIETARYFSESFGIHVGDTVSIPEEYLQ